MTVATKGYGPFARFGRTTLGEYGFAVRGKAEHYRECAERSRLLAQDITDEDAKAHLLDVARQYDKLAAEAETGEER